MKLPTIEQLKELLEFHYEYDEPKLYYVDGYDL